MTVASLIVNLEANVASYLDNMEKAAHHTEMVGRRITRAGIEITKVFAPLAALYAGALAAAVKQSEIVHGQLAQTWDRLVLSARLLLREIGGALTPAFQQMIASKEALIQKARQLVAWFEQLSPATQSLIVKVGLFLAVLGPTIVVVGSVIRAAGALWGIFSQLASLIAGVVVPVFAFLISPIGLITIGIGLLIAAGVLLIRHWELVKQVAAATWQEAKALVLDAIIGILAGVAAIPAGVPVFGALGQAAAAAIPKIVALRNTVQQAATQMYSSLKMDKPLLPEWLTTLPAKIKGLFTLPTVAPLPSLPFLQAQDALAKLDTTLTEASAQSALFGSSFNLAGAQASAFKATIDELLKQGVQLDDVLNDNGLTLRSLGAAYVVLERLATQSTGVISAQNKAITDSFVSLGTQLGQILAGTAHGFSGFGKAMEGVLGGMLTTLGQVLIAYGTAGIAINAFITNPFAAIAAGVALVALGSALSSAAQATLAGSASGAAAAPAAATAAAATSTAPTQGPGTIVIQGGILDMSNPQQADAMAKAIQALTGRRIIVAAYGTPLFGLT